MKILVIDSDGSALDFCLAAQEYGHETELFIRPDSNGDRIEVGDGLVKRINNWKPRTRWADMILLTGNDVYMAELEPLHAERKVFGPNMAAAKLEIDRGHGQMILKEHGIDTPPFIAFNSLDEAEAHVRKTMECYVFKTMGNEGDKSTSYVCKSPADMVARIQRWKAQGRKFKECCLQTKIEGIEMGVSGWFGPAGWCSTWNENFEYKKLMPGNYGPNTGEMGTVMQYTDKSKLADSVLKPLTAYLKGIGYIGDCDVNCIIDKKGKAWPLEFTARLGWPAFRIQQFAHRGDPARWMYDLLHGRDTLKVDPAVCVGIVLAQPDFPYGKFKKDDLAGIPVYGITAQNRRNVSFADIKLGLAPIERGGSIEEGKTLVTAGEYVCVALGKDDSVRAAADQAYKIADQIHFPNAQIRDDIGENLQQNLPELHKHGYARQMRWQS